MTPRLPQLGDTQIAAPAPGVSILERWFTIATFRYKRRSADGGWRTMTLDVLEFLRRFAGHVLPKGFVRIRYWGLLADRNRRERLGLCRELLGAAEPAVDHSGEEPPLEEDEQLHERPAIPTCPRCGNGRLVMSAPLPRQVAGHPPQSRAPT